MVRTLRACEPATTIVVSPPIQWVLRVLVASDTPADDLGQLFSWHVQRLLAAVTAAVAVVGGILAALVADFAKDDPDLCGGRLALVFGACGLVLYYAYRRYRMVRAVNETFPAGLEAVRRLSPWTWLLRLLLG